MSGGVAGAISKTVAAPAERVKLLIQTQSANSRITKQYKGISDCFLRTVREDGFWSLWRGNWANVVRYFPTQALNFAFKDYYKLIFNPHDPIKDPSRFFLGNILAGGMAGTTAAFFVYPLDFARTRLGVDTGRGNARQFTGMFDVISTIFKLEGFRGLYRGIQTATVGIFFYRGLYFGMYDSGKELFLQKDSSYIQKFFFAQFCVLFAEGISYPTDTVKRKLMLQSGRTEVQYTGTRDCVKSIWKQEGIKGFWRGYLSNIFRSVGGSLSLILYDEFNKKSNAL
jgi:solute carrier family 25 (adenine nucleotide translocator) protein 4/5/6/31